MTVSVLIAGGGIAGLAAAITLLQDPSKRFEVTILEQDASKEARIQGFTLGISPLGAAALKEMELIEILAPHAGGGFYNFCIGRSDGSRYLSISKENSQDQIDLLELLHQGKAKLNREILRNVMLDEIQKMDGTILWNAKVVDLQVTNVKVNDDNDQRRTSLFPVQVTLQDGRQLESHLLLGCDGIFSAVRRLLPMSIPESASKSWHPSSPPLRHLGVAWVRGICPDQGQMNHWFPPPSPSKNMTTNYSAAMSDTNGNILLIDSTNEGHIHWFFAFRCQEKDGPTRWDPPFVVASEISRRIRSSPPHYNQDNNNNNNNNNDDDDDKNCVWHSSVSQILQDTLEHYPSSLLFRHLYDRSPLDVETWRVPEPSWMPVTLLGDAFHPVASYALAGGGSNALSDGVACATQLLLLRLTEDADSENENTAAIAVALRAYEVPVRLRSIDQARRSLQYTNRLHSGWMATFPVRCILWVVHGAMYTLNTLKTCGLL
jgi:2-polyprenyl-6-methoxyphenol hydroxylase-like FAD-dependent oxidoreductase